MSMEGNRIKNRLLGMPHGTASSRLRKMILYSMLYGKVYDRMCFRCGEPIDDIDGLSIEHKEAWQSADDPKAAFFDLENIAFSHLRCNIVEGSRQPKPRPVCPKGHRIKGDNLGSAGKDRNRCLQCHKMRQRRYRASLSKSVDEPS